jgi:hypothetical protein
LISIGKTGQLKSLQGSLAAPLHCMANPGHEDSPASKGDFELMIHPFWFKI